MSIKKDIVWRVALVYLGMLAFAVLIAGKIIWIQIFESAELKNKASAVRVKEIEPNRGDIYTCDDRLLASSVPYYEIRMDMRSDGLKRSVFLENIDSLCLELYRLFKDRSPSEYKKDLLNAYKKGERYHLIKRNVSYIELKSLETFPIFRLGQFKGGFICIQDNKRFQPHVTLASRTIGYLSKSKSGNVVGLEGAYDKQLTGVYGKRLMQKIAGNVWMPISDENEVEPEDGKDIVTTIDINIQDVAHTALLHQLQKHEAHHGTAILMEVKTGNIKAIVNLERDKKGNYREAYNYAIGESSEPGSTFKLPVLVAAIEDGFISLNDTIDTGDGTVKYYDKVIRDEKRGGWGKLTVQQVFEASSNVGMSKIVMQHYAGHEHDFINRLYNMRLNDYLGIEIKGEGKPEIKYPGDKYWSGISLAMISQGYEIKLTPLQILTFYNAVANNGKMIKPKFVEEIRYHGKTVKKFSPQVLHPSICSASTIKMVKKMLEGVVGSGTAKNLKNSHFKIAGKTGTAQIANEKYGYMVGSEVSHQASFAGYFPADKPKYSCIVVVNSPSRDVYYGNLVAGPVFLEIANKVFATNFELQDELYVKSSERNTEPPYSKGGYVPDLQFVFNALEIPVKYDTDTKVSWVNTKKQDNYVELKADKINQKLVPNVVEMGAKDAIYVLENAGLKVEIIGRGKVASQSIYPGAPIKKGDVIKLEMSII